MSIPEPLLERYRLGEVSEAERAAVEEALTGADRDRLQALDADDAAILERYPPRVMALEIARRRAAGRRRWVAPTIGSAAVLLGAAAALGIALQASPGSTDGLAEAGFQEAPADDGLFEVRAKGEARVLVYARSSPDTPLDEDATARAGDTIQLALNPGADRFAVLVSIDGRGVITRHLPVAGAQAVAVEPGRTVALPRAYTLDDAPAFERFLLVTGAAPFPVSDVLIGAGDLTDRLNPRDSELPLPDDLDLHVHDFVLHKVSR